MDFIQSILENSTIPALTAFLLGLLTAISPCPLAANITAIGFLSKNIENRNKIFMGGIMYTIGRIIAYTSLGLVLISILREGSSMFAIQKKISEYGEILISPALILIGLFMLFGHKLNLPKFGYNHSADSSGKIKRNSTIGALFLGILFAMAFCPTSGVFYFGVLIPMSATEPAGYIYPLIFAIATGLPVIIAAWILAYSVSKLGKFYNKMQLFQKWLSKIVAILFLVTGLYYAIIYYF